MLKLACVFLVMLGIILLFFIFSYPKVLFLQWGIFILPGAHKAHEAKVIGFPG